MIKSTIVSAATILVGVMVTAPSEAGNISVTKIDAEQAFLSAHSTETTYLVIENNISGINSITRQSGSYIGHENDEISDEMSDFNYPVWLTLMFTLSCVTSMLGVVSLICILLFGASVLFVIGTYFIPTSLMSIYYLLGRAERFNSG